jgi:hypothetical protein
MYDLNTRYQRSREHISLIAPQAKELSPTSRFDFREGAARRIAGSTSTPPFVLPTNMGRKIHIYSRYSEPPWTGNTSILGEPRYHAKRSLQYCCSRASLLQLWSFGKRSCHAIGDEHSIPCGHSSSSKIFVPRAYTLVDHSSGLGDLREGTPSSFTQSLLDARLAQDPNTLYSDRRLHLRVRPENEPPSRTCRADDQAYQC